jgi:diguanylate cyclase (GGDEF)-like protein
MRDDPGSPERRRPASELHATTIRSLHRFSRAIGWVAVLIGALALLRAWGLDLFFVKSALPGLSTLKPNTALAIGSLGVGLLLIADGRSRIGAAAAAGLALAIGVLTLAEFALARNLGIDELLRPNMTTLAAHPGRPASATAAMIALVAAAQLCGQRPALHVAKTVGALTAILIAWASLSGYLFGSELLREVPAVSSVSLLSAATMLLLAFGTLAVDPISWPLRTAFTKGIGGTICRWLLPPAVIAPPLLGWLLSHVGATGTYHDAFRWALYSVGSSLGSVSLVLLLAHRIAVIDAERTLATEMSLHDPLTGLANRRAFDAFLHETFGLAKRHRHALSIALLDIDHFKSYNDDYGHPAGDQLLKSFAGLLSSVARETDLVARIGGEEFVIALPETELAGARAIAERLRAEMEQSALFRRTVTVSIGVAAVTDEVAHASRLVEACDQELYRAKAAGRNRVSASG